MGHGRHGKDDDEGCDCVNSIGYGRIFLSVFLLLWAYLPGQPRYRYSVTIGAVSGLDPATDLQDGGALDPAFNLTVRVDASGSGKGLCLDESTSVQVSYLRVPLAVGRAEGGACAEAGGRRDVEVVARGRGVSMPGFLLDSLAEDMRRGVVARFEVALMSPRNGGWDVMACWAM